MLDKIKATIAREDGSPICSPAKEADTVFLTDAAPVLLVIKSGGTVETFTGDIGSIAEVFRDRLSRMRGKLPANSPAGNVSKLDTSQREKTD